MRQVIASVVMMGCFAAPLFASQSPGAAAAGNPISACSLLSPELVEKFTENKKLLKLFKPEETPVGAKGTHCEHGDIGLQVNPFARPGELRKSPGKDWQPVTGVGDTAFFRANRSDYAELLVWTGPHHFTIQLSVPSGSTPEAIKPNTIALAHAIIPKLR
jgi:hypothetical protein